MDAVSDPSIEKVVLMTSAQVGKTEIMLNTIGYSVTHDPCPMLLVQPTLEMAQAFSKDKLAPMLRDTEALRGKVRIPRGRAGGNTILHKQFDAGHLTISGANSPSSLAARSVRKVLLDEVDRFPPTAGTEGDPVRLAEKRATTFWNRKIIVASTPTQKGLSKIEHDYELSDKRRYFVPCAACGHEQPWDEWRMVHWDKLPKNEKTERKGVTTDKHVHLVDTAGVVCDKCQHRHTEAERLGQVRAGTWRATATSANERVVGFHLNQIISPWVPLENMVREFLTSKDTPELFKTWVNTALGETFEESGETTDAAALYARREDYIKLPRGAVVLTAGVDVQKDRLEVEIVAWGEGNESWGAATMALPGDPSLPHVWERLDGVLLQDYEREDGVRLQVSAVCVDSGGHHTQQVYKFCRPRAGRMVFAIKGIAGPGRPIASRPRKKYGREAALVLVGVDAAKERLLLSALRLAERGPGYCHFPTSYDEEYFEQLTAEKQLTRYKKGFPVKEWVLPKGKRNEKLDCRVYAMAALELLRPNYAIFAARLGAAPGVITRSPTINPGAAQQSQGWMAQNGFGALSDAFGSRPF